jgi:hypothetical protein
LSSGLLSDIYNQHAWNLKAFLCFISQSSFFQTNKHIKMLSCLKSFWKSISTGWVVEYPSSRNGPADLFDRKDRRPWGIKLDPEHENELERCSWPGPGKI